MERRLAAILAADVVGYRRLMGADEEGTLERLGVTLNLVERNQTRSDSVRAVQRTVTARSRCRRSAFVKFPHASA